MKDEASLSVQCSNHIEIHRTIVLIFVAIWVLACAESYGFLGIAIVPQIYY